MQFHNSQATESSAPTFTWGWFAESIKREAITQELQRYMAPALVRPRNSRSTPNPLATDCNNTPGVQRLPRRGQWGHVGEGGEQPVPSASVRTDTSPQLCAMPHLQDSLVAPPHLQGPFTQAQSSS